MTETLEFDDTGLDRWTDDERFDVTRERIAEYAAATNDPIEAHRRGDVAPPVFAIVPVFEALLTPAVDVMPVEADSADRPRRTGLPLPPADPPGRQAGVARQDDRIPGAGEGHSGRDPARMSHRGRRTGQRAVRDDVRAGHVRRQDRRRTEPRPQIRRHACANRRRWPRSCSTSTTTRRSATRRRHGDPMPIHLDEEVARDAGLPGIIAHGLCTMAFTSWAVLTESPTQTSTGSSDSRCASPRWCCPVTTWRPDLA